MTQVAEPEAKRWVGGGILRKEDPELLTGQGSYVEDIALPGMLWIAMVRSPVAHATIVSIDTAAVRELPGVVAAFTGQDLADEWAAALPCVWPIANRTNLEEPTDDARIPDHWPVAKDRVRFMGEIVAVVVADSREHAADAIEAMEVDYDDLPVVTDMETALRDDGPVIHEQFGSNEAYTWRFTNGDVGRVFAEAPVVVKERYYHPRLIPNAIEPRGVVVQPAPAQGEYTIFSATQIPHILKVLLALTLDIHEAKLRVIAPDVGGSFGSKLQVSAEEAVAVALARRLGAPIKWIEERSEAYVATHHGRDVIQDMEVAATEEGKTLGFRVKLYADFGAYLQLLTPGIPILGAWLYHGVYNAQAYKFECTGVFTNKTPTDAYRGSGRPEATYAVERIMDALARRVGKDPAEIRELNFIPPFSEAREVASGLQFDSGNYAPTFQKAKELAGYDELRREQQASGGRRDGKLLGVGVSTYIEMSGIAPSQVLAALKYGAGGWDAATIRCHPTGKVTVITGTSPQGQGHVTTWSQIAADALGVDPDDIEVLHGDTAVSALGMDTYSSRSLSVGGAALYKAAEKIRAKARTIAAYELEVAEEDLEWKDGRFQVAGAPDKAKTIPEIAFSAWTAHALPADVEPGLFASAVWDPPNFTFPAGAHICVVEVDADTGQVFIVKYVAVDDCGTVINPMIVDGQVMGGVAQGIAEAVYEEARYDETGTLLTGNMSTYRVPSAAELPAFTLDRTVTPSSSNPMGVKGIGEAGTIAAPPAVVNAVADALRPLGVENDQVEKPVSPERVWRTIQAAKGRAPSERVPDRERLDDLARTQERRATIWLTHATDEWEPNRVPELDMHTVLARQRRYVLNVGVGINWPTDLVDVGTPPLDPLLPSTDSDLRMIDVAVFSDQVRVIDGSSRSLGLTRIGPCGPVTFTIETPSRRRSARLRVMLSYRNHILQVFEVNMLLAVEEEVLSEERPLQFALVFSRLEQIREVDALPQRLLSMATNANGGGGSHSFMFSGGETVRLSEKLTGNMQTFFRTTLRGAFNRAGKAGALTGGQFDKLIKDMAREGRAIRQHLYDNASETLQARFTQVRQRAGDILQILRLEPEFAFPWAMIYDWDLPPTAQDFDDASVCPGVIDDSPCKCDGQAGKLLCVRGFWGVRHIIEELVRNQDSQQHIPSVAEPVGTPAVVCTVGIKGDRWSTDMVSALVEAWGADAVEDFLAEHSLYSRLRVPTLRPAVLVVVGHLTEKRVKTEPEIPRIYVKASEKYLDTYALGKEREDHGRWALPNCPIVLLLACNSGEDALGKMHSFVAGLASAGASAVIATEQRIDTRLAAGLASAVVPALRRTGPGASLQQWRANLLVERNPFGFLFTCFGSSDVVLTAGQAKPTPVS